MPLVVPSADSRSAVLVQGCLRIPHNRPEKDLGFFRDLLAVFSWAEWRLRRLMSIARLWPGAFRSPGARQFVWTGWARFVWRQAGSRVHNLDPVIAVRPACAAGEKSLEDGDGWAVAWRRARPWKWRGPTASRRTPLRYASLRRFVIWGKGSRTAEALQPPPFSVAWEPRTASFSASAGWASVPPNEKTPEDPGRGSKTNRNCREQNHTDRK